MGALRKRTLPRRLTSGNSEFRASTQVKPSSPTYAWKTKQFPRLLVKTWTSNVVPFWAAEARGSMYSYSHDILWPQSAFCMGTLGPKYQIYWYLDPLGSYHKTIPPPRKNYVGRSRKLLTSSLTPSFHIIGPRCFRKARRGFHKSGAPKCIMIPMVTLPKSRGPKFLETPTSKKGWPCDVGSRGFGVRHLPPEASKKPQGRNTPRRYVSHGGLKPHREL